MITQGKRRCFGWIALFAIALQLVLAWGHHHDSHQPVRASSGSCPGLAKACALLGESDTHDTCEICWAIAIAAAGALPPPVLISAPTAVPIVVDAQAVAAEAVGREFAPFAARGPPATA
jgi:hypothetical protein